jgi:hypothetical protein
MRTPSNPSTFLFGAAFAACVASIPAVAHADDAPATPAPAANDASHGLPTEGSVVAGLTQWVLFRGGNIGGELRIGRLALEVSHGQGLNLNEVPGLALSSAERAAGAHVFVPWTTGFGVGLRITRDLTVLVEAKAHHYNVTGNDARHEVDYTTFSVGPSVFYTVHVYKGLFLEPNVRFWPNVASTLNGSDTCGSAPGSGGAPIGLPHAAGPDQLPGPSGPRVTGPPPA